MWTVQLYTDWVNDCLQKTNCARRVTNLQTDLADSHLLCRLVEAVGMAARLAYLFTPARTVTIHCWVRFLVFPRVAALHPPVAKYVHHTPVGNKKT